MIAILRGRLVASNYNTLGEELGATTISVAELTHGAHRSAKQAENLAEVSLLFSTMKILSFDEQSARLFGRLKAQLQLASHPLDDLDLMIASIALTHHAPLVTHNQRHFRRVPDLVLEDWIDTAREP